MLSLIPYSFILQGHGSGQRGSAKTRRTSAGGPRSSAWNSRHAVWLSFPNLQPIYKERKGLMDLPKQYDDAERRFLKSQAQELRNNNQPCELHTRTQGSLYRGRVMEADEGGIVFQQEDGRRVAVPISLVEKFFGIPISWGQATGDVKARAGAAGGSAF